MMISLQPTNVIPIGSNIIVEFPFSLAWAKDVNQANQLPIDGTQSCTGYSSVRIN